MYTRTYVCTKRGAAFGALPPFFSRKRQATHQKLLVWMMEVNCIDEDIYIYMYLCIHVCMYIYTHTYVYLHTSSGRCPVCAPRLFQLVSTMQVIFIYIHIYIYIHTYIYIYVKMYIYTHVYMHTYISVCIY